MSAENIRRIKEQADEPKPKKVYQIAKVSKKRAAKLEAQKEMTKLDHEFYKEHYAACPHKCECCGAKLPKEPLTTFFHHILEKRNYPQFRHVHENILLVCPDCHNQIETLIDKVPFAKIRRAEVEKLLLNENL